MSESVKVETEIMEQEDEVDAFASIDAESELEMNLGGTTTEVLVSVTQKLIEYARSLKTMTDKTLQHEHLEVRPVKIRRDEAETEVAAVKEKVSSHIFNLYLETVGPVKALEFLDTLLNMYCEIERSGKAFAGRNPTKQEWNDLRSKKKQFAMNCAVNLLQVDSSEIKLVDGDESLYEQGAAGLELPLNQAVDVKGLLAQKEQKLEEEEEWSLEALRVQMEQKHREIAELQAEEEQIQKRVAAYRKEVQDLKSRIGASVGSSITLDSDGLAAAAAAAVASNERLMDDFFAIP